MTYDAGDLLAVDYRSRPSVIVVAYEDEYRARWAVPYVGGLLVNYDEPTGWWFVRQPTSGGDRRIRPLSLASLERVRVLVSGPPALEVPLAPWLWSLHRTPKVVAPASRESGTGYGEAALVEEAAKVARAPHGGRNQALNAAAFSLGQLVPQGALDVSKVWWSLTAAARAAGLPDREIIATLKGGLSAGMQRPRRLP